MLYTISVAAPYLIFAGPLAPLAWMIGGLLMLKVDERAKKKTDRLQSNPSRNHMTDRSIDEKDVAMFREGFRAALQMAEGIARRDRRVDLARRCGHVPGWQKGRWMVADELAAELKKAEESAGLGQ